MNPGCNVYFYIGDATTVNNVLKIMVTIPSVQLPITWPTTPSTGFFDTTAATQYTFNVRTTCVTSAFTSPRTYYVDDLSLVAA